MKNVSVGFDEELGELIIKGPEKWEKDEGEYWLSVAIGMLVLIGFAWAGLIILLH